MAEIGNGFDPSKLHLKKELTAIRKAARVLRDPGTTTSWRSPISSSRSIANNVVTSIDRRSSPNVGLNENTSQLSSKVSVSGGNGKEKLKQKVFLYNWKAHRSSSEKSNVDPVAKWGEDDNEGGSVLGSGSADDSLSGARNGGDSISDAYVGDDQRQRRSSNNSSMIFRCRDTSIGSLVTPSMRRSISSKKKWKKNGHSSAMLRNHHHQQQQEKVLFGVKNSDPRKCVERIDDSIESSEEYSISEVMRRVSGESPLLSRHRKGNQPHSSSSKLIRNIRNSRKDDSSYTYNSTPALSTSSYNQYAVKNPSTIGSWDGTTASYNDGDDEDMDDDHLELPNRQGCGIPCYWSKRTPKHKGACGSCYSPSLSDTLRRKGSRILCGSQSSYNRHRKMVKRSGQGVLPLLNNSCDGRGMTGSSIGTGLSDDELSTNFGELDLEALSRLDGRRWSSCRSRDGLGIVVRNGEGEEEECTPENMKSLSQKYRPIFFDELIGQNIVVQSLVNAISKGRIAPVYLFQGPRGTGKTSTARIFAAALNCLATEETKPCGYCMECANFMSGKSSRYLREVDGTNKNGINKIRYLLKNMPMRSSSSASLPFTVVAIDECHVIPTKTWLAFLKFLEDPPSRVVFVFITTDLDNVPRTVLSRCQKYIFNKIKDGDIVTRLSRIATDENLNVESDALDLIALNADGSLRDAETMLDQLSLLGKRVTASLVNELVGIVSDEKLLELLELAMSSDTAETVKRARELMDSGADPMVLMSQLASLIMDIIAGSCDDADAKLVDSSFVGNRLSEAELEKLKHALKLLSEAEKQLRVSSERSTWFTATLLQLGSVPSPALSLSSSSRRQSSKTTEEDPSSTSKEASSAHLPKLMSPTSLPNKAATNSSTHQQSPLSLIDGHNSKLSHSRLTEINHSHDEAIIQKMTNTSINSEKLNDIWSRCIDRCHSKTLRHLLYTHGKLVSISQVEGSLVAYIAFGNGDVKSRAERFLSSITNSFEIVLRCNVGIILILLPNGEASPKNAAKSEELAETSLVLEREREAPNNNLLDKYSDVNSSNKDPLKVSRSSFNDSEGSPSGKMSGRKERKHAIPMRRIESIIREQRLETAWLQATERSTPGTLNRLKPEKNQVLPQDGKSSHNQIVSISSNGMSSQHWEDDLNHDLKILKIKEGKFFQKDQTAKKSEHYPMSPSLLHDTSYVGNYSKENLGYESGTGNGGCSGLFCWNSRKQHNKGLVKVKAGISKQGTGGRFIWFGECVKSQSKDAKQNQKINVKSKRKCPV